MELCYSAANLLVNHIMLLKMVFTFNRSSFFSRMCCGLVFLCGSGSVSADFYLEKSPEIKALGKTDSQALCRVAKNTAQYIASYEDDNYAVHAGRVFNQEVTLPKVLETLSFLCKIAKEDEVNATDRLNEQAFLKQHFDFYRWRPNLETAKKWADKSNNQVKQRLLRNIPEDKLFITKYYTKLLNASEEKSAQFNQAIYGLPFDEQTLSLEVADSQPALTRHKYTRQQIINGALNGLAPPLLWLSEDALHDVLLQGTGVV
jgi:hypothetical protein